MTRAPVVLCLESSNQGWIAFRAERFRDAVVGAGTFPCHQRWTTPGTVLLGDLVSGAEIPARSCRCTTGSTSHTEIGESSSSAKRHQQHCHHDVLLHAPFLSALCCFSSGCLPTPSLCVCGGHQRVENKLPLLTIVEKALRRQRSQML